MKNTLLFIALILAGCSSTQIVSTWKNPEVQPGKFSPIMIVGIMKDDDSTLCRKMEQRFADRLKELGYNAFSSIAVYGPGVYENIQEEETFKLIYARSVGAVVTIELLEKQKEEYPAPLWLDNNYNRHIRPYEQSSMLPPEQTLVQTNYVWESNYYDANGFLMLYSVTSKTYQPGSEKSVAADYSKVIVDDMVKKGLIKKQVVVLKAF